MFDFGPATLIVFGLIVIVALLIAYMGSRYEVALEGSLRSIVGTLTVEELNLDRQKFQQAVQSAAIGDLATSGLVIDSFTIQAPTHQGGCRDGSGPGRRRDV